MLARPDYTDMHYVRTEIASIPTIKELSCWSCIRTDLILPITYYYWPGPNITYMAGVLTYLWDIMGLFRSYIVTANKHI